MRMLNATIPGCKAIAIKEVTGRHLYNLLLVPLLFVTIPGLTSCYQYAAPAAVAQPAPAVQKTPSVQVYFYPKMGQTVEQQDRDRYECYHWAMDQTGFDPGAPSIPAEHRITVVPVPPPGHDTAVGAVTGAAIGAIAAGPRHAGNGALIGAAAGALAGAVSDTARQEQAKQMEDAHNKQNQDKSAQLERKALDFRRAMAACLEGRGYTTR